MIEVGVQSQNVVYDENPNDGFAMLKKAGFSCTDFSLNTYFINKKIYQSAENGFFKKSTDELIDYFTPHKEAAVKNGIRINQMHMPYPIFVPGGRNGINDFLWNEVAVKSMAIAKALECPHIVVHGFKLTRYYGSEEAEWAKTKEFLEYLIPMAKDAGTIVCVENLYNGKGSHMMEGPCCNARKAAERLDELNEIAGEELFGFCLDTGHANLVGIDMVSNSELSAEVLAN